MFYNFADVIGPDSHLDHAVIWRPANGADLHVSVQDPSGDTVTSFPVAAPGNRTVSARALHLERPLAPGLWRVLYSSHEARPLAETAFVVLPACSRQNSVS